MRVTLIGTGGPRVSPDRGGAATLVETAGASVLIDCGAGVTQRLAEMKRDAAGIDALLVTHLHSDHLIDFYKLVVSSWHQGRARPWIVHCPETVVPVIEGTMAVWAEECALRIEWERHPSVAGVEVSSEIVAAGREILIGDLAIEPVLVDHAPVAPAYGVVLRSGGRSAVVSVDTRVSDALIAAGQGCDLLVHEAFLHRAMPAIPGQRSAETVARVAAYHTRSDEVGRVARDGDESARADPFRAARIRPRGAPRRGGGRLCGPRLRRRGRHDLRPLDRGRRAWPVPGAPPRLRPGGGSS